MKPCKFRHNDESGKLSCELGQSLRSCGLCTMRQLPASTGFSSSIPVEEEVKLAQDTDTKVLPLTSQVGGGCACKKKAPVTS